MFSPSKYVKILDEVGLLSAALEFSLGPRLSFQVLRGISLDLPALLKSSMTISSPTSVMAMGGAPTEPALPAPSMLWALSISIFVGMRIILACQLPIQLLSKAMSRMAVTVWPLARKPTEIN